MNSRSKIISKFWKSKALVQNVYFDVEALELCSRVIVGVRNTEMRNSQQQKKREKNRWARMFTKMLVFCVLLLSMRNKMYVHVWKLRLIGVNTVRPEYPQNTNTGQGEHAHSKRLLWFRFRQISVDDTPHTTNVRSMHDNVNETRERKNCDCVVRTANTTEEMKI